MFSKMSDKFNSNRYNYLINQKKKKMVYSENKNIIISLFFGKEKSLCCKYCSENILTSFVFYAHLQLVKISTRLYISIILLTIRM